jgi:hypothetical protein
VIRLSYAWLYRLVRSCLVRKYWLVPTCTISSSIAKHLLVTAQSLRRLSSWAVQQEDAGAKNASVFVKPLTEQTPKELILTLSTYVLTVRKSKPDKRYVGDPYGYPGATLKANILSFERHLKRHIDKRF